MIPDNRLSSQVVSSSFVEPVNRRTVPLVDYEFGGPGLQQPGRLDDRLWTVRVEGSDVIISSEGNPDTVLFSRPGITEVALAFDQAMRPFIAFVQNGQARYWWYDSQAGGVVFTDLPEGSVTPRASLDEKREAFQSRSDIILTYVRGTTLYYRQQRDRFLVEYTLQQNFLGTLVAVGINQDGRLQWSEKPAT